MAGESGRRLRLLFVLPTPVRGGAEEVVLELVKRLDRSVFEIALACPGALLEKMVRELSSLEVRTAPLAANSWRNVWDVWALARLIRSFRPDIVNPHMFRATWVAAPMAKALGVPRVIETYHGREAWRKGPMKGRFFVDRKVYTFVDRIIAVSNAARNFLVVQKGVPPAKISVIPNGRELSRFQPGVGGGRFRASVAVAPGTPLLGIVGRLEPQKGHEVLLRAMPDVIAERPDARLAVVGNGSLEKRLRRLTKELRLEDHVLFAGFRADVAECMDDLDLVVMPSHYEGMPLVAIEAAALAKPVVATRFEGAEEVIRDGVTGRLVPLDDPPALASAIVELLGQREKLAEMGRIARELCTDRFDVDRNVRETAELYLQVADREVSRS